MLFINKWIGMIQERSEKKMCFHRKNDNQGGILTASSWKSSWYSKTFISKLRFCFCSNVWRLIEWVARTRLWISLMEIEVFDRDFGLRIERSRWISFWYAVCCDLDGFGNQISGAFFSFDGSVLMIDDAEKAKNVDRAR